MRVTKTSEQAYASLNRKRRANRGCNMCPCCGEDKPTTYYGPFEHKGILTGLQKHNTGFFSSGTVCDLYFCETCGAEWESDPYPYN